MKIRYPYLNVPQDYVVAYTFLHLLCLYFYLPNSLIQHNSFSQTFIHM